MLTKQRVPGVSEKGSTARQSLRNAALDN